MLANATGFEKSKDVVKIKKAAQDTAVLKISVLSLTILLEP